MHKPGRGCGRTPRGRESRFKGRATGVELSAAEVKSKSRKLPFQFPFLCGPRVWGLPTEGTLLLVDGSMGESEYHGMPPLGFCLELVPWLGLPSYHSGMPSKTRVRGQPESFSMIRGSHGKALTPDSASGLCRSCPAGCLQQIRADSRLSLGGRRKGARCSFVTQLPLL